MSFLDDLLTLNNLQGEKLPTVEKKSWWDKLRKKPVEPEYRVHMTQAGFPVVLPHRQDGSFYTSIKNLEAGVAMETETELWALKNRAINLSCGFALEATEESRLENGSHLLSSQIFKYFNNPQQSIGEVKVAHTVTLQGQVIGVKIIYSFTGERCISFHALRQQESGNTTAYANVEFMSRLAFDPEGNVLVQHLNLNIPVLVQMDYDGTLRNLVTILKKEAFNEEDLRSLYSLGYAVPKFLGRASVSNRNLN